jgi:hypothetical protein
MSTDHAGNDAYPAPDDPPTALPEGHLVSLTEEDLAAILVKTPGPVTLPDRQGVFVHSFKCSVCDLEFAVFSWRAHRHRVGSVCCPECGRRTPMLHWVAQTSNSVAFEPRGPGLEIFAMNPRSGSSLLDDSILPGPDRYTTAGGADPSAGT